jgi:hypothetical protein
VFRITAKLEPTFVPGCDGGFQLKRDTGGREERSGKKKRKEGTEKEEKLGKTVEYRIGKEKQR